MASFSLSGNTNSVCRLYAAFSAFSSQESPCQQCDTGSYSLMTSGVRAPDLQICGPVRYTRVRGRGPGDYGSWSQHPSTCVAMGNDRATQDEYIQKNHNKSSAVAEMGDRLATIGMGRKVGCCCAPFRGGEAGSSCNTMSPGPRRRPTSVPSDILIHPAV